MHGIHALPQYRRHRCPLSPGTGRQHPVAAGPSQRQAQRGCGLPPSGAGGGRQRSSYRVLRHTDNIRRTYLRTGSQGNAGARRSVPKEVPESPRLHDKMHDRVDNGTSGNKSIRGRLQTVRLQPVPDSAGGQDTGTSRIPLLRTSQRTEGLPVRRRRPYERPQRHRNRERRYSFREGHAGRDGLLQHHIHDRHTGRSCGADRLPERPSHSPTAALDEEHAPKPDDVHRDAGAQHHDRHDHNHRRVLRLSHSRSNRQLPEAARRVGDGVRNVGLSAFALLRVQYFERSHRLQLVVEFHRVLHFSRTVSANPLRTAVHGIGRVPLLLLLLPSLVLLATIPVSGTIDRRRRTERSGSRHLRGIKGDEQHQTVDERLGTETIVERR